ncbi:MAG: hypothetical protein OEZ44_07315 [Candidatus Bathyarchaeota archaeon]|nr:hypothetical protein [Candidatus Bathyarchaeota archaeon]
MDRCQDSEIGFDDSSIKRIFSDPEGVLEDVNGFWEREVPYKTTMEWSDATRVPIDYEGFRARLEELRGQAPEDRRRHEAYRLSERIMESAPNFRARALPHVCSYLPEGTRVDSVVRTACFIPPWAYFSREGVIINTSHRHWEDDAGMVLNIIVHELFHVGFGRYIEPIDFSKMKTREQTIDLLSRGLQNEGMATYVAYRARQIFPSSAVDLDYTMLENRADVLRLGEKINRLLELGRSKPFGEIRDTIWQEGVRSRAYYVVGAHMAGRIEEAYGRDALVDTIVKGSRRFIEAYNGLPSDGLKIII